MKTIFSAALLAFACETCLAAGIAAAPGVRLAAAPITAFEVERLPFGSGTPAQAETAGSETANIVVDGLYHVPNYMPGFPTAATIWPRELPLECEGDAVDGGPHCTGYRVLPAVGRGEYIFVRPYVKPAPPVIQALPPQPQPQPQPQQAPVTNKKPLG